MEDSIKMRFGRTRRMSQGASAQRQHLLQNAKACRRAAGALKSALAFQVACSVGIGVSELQEDFAAWWQNSGERVIFNNFPVVAWQIKSKVVDS